jgi:hypothetical protein
VVVAVGETEIDEPVKLPGIHTYVAAPVAVSVAEPPTQIADAEVLAVTEGSGFTVTETVAVAEQPAAFVPVTV